ncbi:PLP-dependent aminotransferase family protein [Nocardioides sp.]|uniref:aminotransferase-like domain-containing protein n=1 Tax=Nocardioides sp. TaxID=35761 RepID=UPI003513DDCB
MHEPIPPHSSRPLALSVTLDRAAAEPLPRQLGDAVRRLVLDGALAPGSRVPSSRALAADLGVSRAVVEQAYDQLRAEGWLTGRVGAGTFVAAGTRSPAVGPSPRPATAPVAPPLVRLDAGTPWIDPRHRDGWRRAWREVAAATPPRGYPDPHGLRELRVALAERLHRLRGVRCDPDEVVLTAGTTEGLRHLLAVLPPGPVGVEDPGYRAAVAVVQDAGRAVVDLAVGEVATRPAAAWYLTPAHQHPLGRVMPAAERLAWLAAARRLGGLLVEDDYDSEFRYDVAPVPALASLDRDHVAYLGTASKAVAPGLRLGWLVPPPHLRDAVLARLRVRHDGPAWPVQRAFWTLLRDGYVDRVVRSARRVYRDRAPRVGAAMTGLAEPAGPAAGMYSTWLAPATVALTAHDAARAAGFDVPLLSDYTRASPLTGLVIGFGGVTDAELDRALDALTAPWR